jgi:adenosylcobyric acid synthase
VTAPALMVQGCTSWAGKSLVTTALCRWFARQGVDVVPFKSQNMTNNARVTPSGGELGSAQWLQALAAGVEPDVRMNPVLLKPEGETASQVVVLGQVDHELSARAWRGRSATLWPVVVDAYDTLAAAHDLVVLEGAGSPAETNLADHDIVNMRMAHHADARVLLVADIDRGGAFAHLFGTWALVPEADRARIDAFLLNRFRGDVALVDPAPAQLEARTGVPTVGILPMLDHDLPDEDGAATRGQPLADTALRVRVVRYPTASNLDEFSRLQRVASVAWATRPGDLDDADLVVLPGSKHVHHDLGWLRARGLDAAVVAAARRGTRVLGVCGGHQLLGQRLLDPAGVDGPAGSDVPGLGLLPMTTRFAVDKATRPVAVTLPSEVPSAWRVLAGVALGGYEIRHGRTTATGGVRVGTGPDGDLGVAVDNVLGLAIHGLLEDDAVLRALTGRDPGTSLDDGFDLLADAIDAHLDTELLWKMTGLR